MFAPKAILIDMDDTLFDEVDYVKSGFAAVARYLEKERDLPADYSLPSMVAFFELEGRGSVFDRVIERFEVRHADGLVQECINIYRNHKPDIQPYVGIPATLSALSGDYELALVTNGLPIMQRRKLDALEVAQYFGTVIFCDDMAAAKPDPAGLLKAIDVLGVDKSDVIMVGDNPATDAAAANAAEIPFVRVRSNRFKSVANPENTMTELSSLCELPSFLNGT